MDPDGLNVLAVWPHAHTTGKINLLEKIPQKLQVNYFLLQLIGRKIKTRHFRGDTELPWIEFDQNFDFNLQSFRTLDPMVKILRGDQLTVECEFDSTQRNSTVMVSY